MPSGRQGFLLSHRGQEERDEQDTLDRLHSDVCQVLLCPDKFHSRGLLASAQLENSTEGHARLQRSTQACKTQLEAWMDPCPENFMPAYEASQYPETKFQWVWVEGKRESASLGFLSTETLAVTQAMQKWITADSNCNHQQTCFKPTWLMETEILFYLIQFAHLEVRSPSAETASSRSHYSSTYLFEDGILVFNITFKQPLTVKVEPGN